MKTLILMTILTGCGAQDKTNNPDVVNPGKETVAQNNRTLLPADGKTVTGVQVEATVIPTYAVASKDNLTPCVAERNQQIIYVKADKAFYVCDSLSWQVVEITPGKDGVDGKNGKDGVNGKDGKDGQTVSNGMWYDPIAKKYWTMGATYNSNPSAVCTGDWKVPSAAEISLAADRGMAIAASQAGAKTCALYILGSAELVVGSNSSLCSQQANQGVYCLQK